MDPVLDTWQRKALSECVGQTILDFYDGDPPLWAKVTTDDLVALRPLVIDRLRQKKSNDVADIVDGAKDFMTRALHQRFKSLREKKRREAQKLASLQSMSQDATIILFT